MLLGACLPAGLITLDRHGTSGTAPPAPSVPFPPPAVTDARAVRDRPWSDAITARSRRGAPRASAAASTPRPRRPAAVSARRSPQGSTVGSLRRGARTRPPERDHRAVGQVEGGPPVQPLRAAVAAFRVEARVDLVEAQRRHAGRDERRLEPPRRDAAALAAGAVAGGERRDLVEEEQLGAVCQTLRCQLLKARTQQIQCFDAQRRVRSVRVAGSWKRPPRLPRRSPRAGVATSSPNGVTRFCSGRIPITAPERTPSSASRAGRASRNAGPQAGARAGPRLRAPG
jgi:hypothetical protein